MYFIDILLFSSIQAVHVFSAIYLVSILQHYNEIYARHRRQIAVKNDTKHKWVCLSVTEKNDRATYFPNVPRKWYPGWS